MKTRPWLMLGLAGSVLLFSGCGKKGDAEAGHNHSEHAEGEEGEGGVTFKEGRGLLLVPEVVKALGLRTVEAEERQLTAERNITTQVFATKPQVLATARVVADQADSLEKASFTEARLVRIDHSTATATRLVDVVFELDASTPRKVGDFVTVALKNQAASALTVPRSALLDGATGTFVYVVNSGAYLRAPVKVGSQTADSIEITEGIYAGDVVVVAPVDQLWLAELRLTKGGGHSH